MPVPAALRRVPASVAPEAATGAPVVSVVLTTFDSEAHVAEALQSILDQDLIDLEVLVVDDGSRDATVEIVRAFAARDARVRLLQIPRCGRIPSLNHGFRSARAAFIANQDADDVSLPHRLRLEVEALRSHPTWAMVGAARVPLIDEAGALVAERVRPTDPARLRRALGHSMPFFHSSCLYRRSAWEEAGGFDESLALLEDYDLWVRLAAKHELANLPQALGHKRRHAGQAFDGMHWTRKGYRTRARILLRYFRGVRHDPRVLARAALYQVMGPNLRLAWIKVSRRDPIELAVRERMQR